MFDWDDELPDVKTSLREELVSSAGMVRSLMKVSLAVGATVGVAATIAAMAVERARRV